MTIEEFLSSIKEGEPPPLSRELLSLWHDARGAWNRAHEVVQEEEGPNAAWVHAYLHRKEGDMSNAAYWYRAAGKKMYQGALEREWDEIVNALLQAGGD